MFGVIHFLNAVAVAVVWAVTGSVVLAGALALVEPLANAAALHAFNRWWARAKREASSVGVSPPV